MDINGKPTHIEDYLARLHEGQWFGWSDSKNKIYANLIIHDNSKSKPTEQECINGLAELQFDMAMEDLRAKRNKLLADTDYLALSDNTMSAEMRTYRQSLRDITNGLTTVADVEAVVFPTKPAS